MTRTAADTGSTSTPPASGSKPGSHAADSARAGASRPSGQPAIATSPEAPGSAAAQDGERLGTPNERDESTGDAGTAPNGLMEQARKDLEAGQVDTDLRNTGGTDEERRDELLRRER